MDIELKHTWRISKQAWYIRLYLWVWGAEEADVTFCKLWWAYVFMWLALPIRLVLSGCGLTKRLMKRTCRRIGDLFRTNREWEDIVMQATKPTPVRHEARAVRYPGEVEVGEPSAVGEFLGTLKPKRFSTQRPVQSPVHSFVTMQKMLEKIATGAASLSMKSHAVRYAMGQDIRRVGKAIRWVGDVVAVALVDGVLLVGDVLRVLVKPVAFGAGGVFAFLLCTGQLLWAGVARSLPYVDRSLDRTFTLIGKMIWLSLWPVRKAFSWVDRYLGKAGTVLAILWGGIAVICYVGALVYAIGVSILAHPLLVPLIFASFGAVVGLCVGVSFLFAYVMEKWFAPMFFREVIQPAWKGTEKSGEALAAGTVGFGKIMLIGFKAVKSNTCPKIEVEE